MLSHSSHLYRHSSDCTKARSRSALGLNQPHWLPSYALAYLISGLSIVPRYLSTMHLLGVARTLRPYDSSPRSSRRTRSGLVFLDLEIVTPVTRTLRPSPFPCYLIIETTWLLVACRVVRSVEPHSTRTPVYHSYAFFLFLATSGSTVQLYQVSFGSQSNSLIPTA
jgi:hypothetical protein